MTMMIEARGLARTFRTRQGLVEAVCGVDFGIDEGEIVGFLGPNGAGKTTTQRMLATLLTPTAGEASVGGCDLRRDPVGVRRQLGYVSQAGGTNPMAAVDEELVVQAELCGMRRADARRRARELRDSLDLQDLGSRLIKTLSGGQKRRVDIALGLMHRPRLLFLDEPSTGLDPQSRANLWAHIRSVRDRDSTTVFLTTHYLEEADALCDRIVIIDHGRIVAEGTPAELKRRIAGDLVILELASEAAIEPAIAVLREQAGARDVTNVDRMIRFVVDHGDQEAVSMMRLLDNAQLAVTSLHVARPTLDHVFLTLTGRSLRDVSPEITSSQTGA
jgi:ABC-2 type transport system ATP-binding protein